MLYKSSLSQKREAFHVPPSQLCIFSHRYHSKSSLPALPSQRKHGYGPPHGFWCQQKPKHDSLTTAGSQTQTRHWCLRVAAQATQTRMAPVSSTAQGHQHGFRQKHRPYISTWPLLVTWATNINTDPGCSRSMDPDMAQSDTTWISPWLQEPVQATHINMAPSRSRVYGYQCGFRLQHRFQKSAWPSVVKWARKINVAQLPFSLLPTRFRPLGLGTCFVLLDKPEYYSTS